MALASPTLNGIFDDENQNAGRGREGNSGMVFHHMLWLLNFFVLVEKRANQGEELRRLLQKRFVASLLVVASTGSKRRTSNS